MILKSKLAAAVAATASLLFSTAHSIPVDLELVLLNDVSGSVSSTEYQLMLDGYGSAFRSAPIISLVENSANGIAVNISFWSDASSQQNMIDWRHLTNAREMIDFANRIVALGRPFVGMTAPGSALNWANNLFANNGFEGTRNVVDVAGVGVQNSGFNTSVARDAALASNVDTINGLTIGGQTGLNQWYKDNLVGGDNAFAMHATDFTTFEAAVASKIAREISGNVPDTGSTLALLGLGFLGLVGIRRRFAK